MRIKSITIIPLALVLCLLNNAEALRGSGLHRDGSRKLAKKAKGEHKHGMMRVVKAAKKAAKMILEEEVDDEEESFVVNIEEEFKPHEIEKKTLPEFSLKFYVKSDKNPAESIGNYNELQLVTEEYLERRFQEVFSPTPAILESTNVTLKQTKDPLIVDVTIDSGFVIPGDVPTFTLLDQKVQEAFDKPKDGHPFAANLNVYIDDLGKMSDTNPFQSTVKVEFIYKKHGADKQEEPKSSSSLGDLIWPLVLGFAFFGLVLLVLLWIRQRKAKKAKALSTSSTRRSWRVKRGYVPKSKPMASDERSTSTASSTAIRADEESLRYLDNVRKQYSTTNGLQEVPLVNYNKQVGDYQRKEDPSAKHVVELDHQKPAREETPEMKDGEIIMIIPGESRSEDQEDWDEEEIVEEEEEIEVEEPEEEQSEDLEDVQTKDLFSMWEKRTSQGQSAQSPPPSQRELIDLSQSMDDDEDLQSPPTDS